VLTRGFSSATVEFRLNGAGRAEAAAAGVAMAGVDAEQLAGRLAGVGGEQFKIIPGGEAFAALPFMDGGDGETQVGGDLFQGDSLFASPSPESVGKALANLTFESRPWKHTGIPPQIRAGWK
jgi:hypothetical protein